MLAGDVGRADRAELIAEAFCAYDRMHLTEFDGALLLMGASDDARSHVAGRARDEFLALVVAAWLNLPDEDEGLRRRADEVIARYLEGELGPEEQLRGDDCGQLARWVADERQAEVGERLIGALADVGEIGAQRHEAGSGLVALAGGLLPGTASRLLDRLLDREEDVATASQLTGGQSHPNDVFARQVMHAPPARDEVRAIALRATLALAGRCGRVPELQDRVSEALGDEAVALRVIALRESARREELAAPDLRAAVADEQEAIRAVALEELARTGALEDEDPALIAACDRQGGLRLRGAALAVVAEAPGQHAPARELLCADEDVYIRARARAAR